MRLRTPFIILVVALLWILAYFYVAASISKGTFKQSSSNNKIKFHQSSEKKIVDKEMLTFSVSDKKVSYVSTAMTKNNENFEQVSTLKSQQIGYPIVSNEETREVHKSILEPSPIHNLRHSQNSVIQNSSPSQQDSVIHESEKTESSLSHNTIHKESISSSTSSSKWSEKDKLNHKNRIQNKVYNKPSQMIHYQPLSLNPIYGQIQFHKQPNIPIINSSLRTVDTSKPLKPIINNPHKDGIETEYIFEYPSFVLPPPLNVESTLTASSFTNAGFYQMVLGSSYQQCIQDSIYNSKETSVNMFHSVNCKENPGLCGNSNTWLTYCQNQYHIGKIWIIKNSNLPMNIDCGWSSPYYPSNFKSSMTSRQLEGKYVFLPIPDGWSIQHFVDGVLPKLVQMESLLNDPNVKFLVELQNNRFPIVEKLYNRLGISSDRLLYSKQYQGTIHFEELIFPCITPPIHPYLWQRAQYLLKLPHIINPNLPEPDTIVYISRNQGTYNGGRRVVNEEQILEYLRDYLSDTPYKLVLFRAKDYPDLDSLFEFWSHAKIVLGPHGGAFANVIFWRPHTVLLEFLYNNPGYISQHYNYRMMFYLEATMLDMNYHSVLCNAINGGINPDLDCDFNTIKTILDNYIN
ncbi:hypothetical protein WA158_004952 [Blastocystis sp. Blastoise]